MLNRSDYTHWLQVARKLTRRRDEAEDVLHESLLAAVEARRTDLSDAQTRAWFAGVLRNKAMMAARTAARRKQRESAHPPPPQVTLSAPDREMFDAIRALPAAARIVAVLALHGLNREELAYVLDLSPEALRQRLTTLRRRWRDLPAEARDEVIVQAHTHRRTVAQELEAGLVRRALLAFLREQPGVGTHDPDGHLIIIEKDFSSRRAPRRQPKGRRNQEI